MAKLKKGTGKKGGMNRSAGARNMANNRMKDSESKKRRSNAAKKRQRDKAGKFI